MPDLSKSDAAYARAKEKIAEALKSGATDLDLSGAPLGEEVLTALDHLPLEIAHCTALQSLTLRGTQVADIAPLQSLTALQSLSLWGTQVADNGPLQSLSALQILNLRRTQVADIAPLQSLTALQSLDLLHTEVTDLRPLQSLTALQHLNLNGTQVTDLQPLQSLTALQSLDLEGTQVTDLRPIRDLPKLDGTGGADGLRFQYTRATTLDPELARLSEIEGDAERTQSTLTYLRGLTDWPPAEKPESFDKPPEEPKPPAGTQNSTGHMTPDQAATRRDRISELDEMIDAQRERIAALEAKLEAGTKTADEMRGRLEAENIAAVAALGETARNANDALEQNAEKQQQKLREEIAAAIVAYDEENQLAPPVRAWKQKADAHGTARDAAYRNYLGFMCVVGLLTLAIIAALLFQGDFLADAIAPRGCSDETPDLCRGFNFKATILGAALLTIYTVLLAVARLQLKVYLSERHLALDATERRALAVAYIGFLRREKSSADADGQREIVYSALFRPSTDGIVKDDSGFDPSMSAAMARILTNTQGRG